MRAMSISEGRKKLFELREKVVTDHDSVILTHKRGNIVLISMEEWEIYKETLHLLRDKSALKALIKSFEDHDTGKIKGKTVEEIFPDLA
jgi:prevent-host-death family protein